MQANSRDSEALFDTKIRGRVYVTVGGNELLRVTYYDNNNKRVKQIDLGHSHRGMKPHTHHGYEHNERDGAKGATNLTSQEKKMIANVRKQWYDYLNNKK